MDGPRCGHGSPRCGTWSKPRCGHGQNRGADTAKQGHRYDQTQVQTLPNLVGTTGRAAVGLDDSMAKRTLRRCENMCWGVVERHRTGGLPLSLRTTGSLPVGPVHIAAAAAPVTKSSWDGIKRNDCRVPVVVNPHCGFLVVGSSLSPPGLPPGLLYWVALGTCNSLF